MPKMGLRLKTMLQESHRIMLGTMLLFENYAGLLGCHVTKNQMKHVKTSDHYGRLWTELCYPAPVIV